MRTLLSLIPKPSRYIGNEEGSVHKQPQDCTLRIALGFPDLYEVGMSYLGQKILYSILNQTPNWWAERVFTPCKDAGAIIKEHGKQLATLESATPLHLMDAIGLSITHELCYTNVLYMLDLAGIPFYSEQRFDLQKNGRPWPLIIAGGGCALSAEPLAPFVDIMLLGEGEESLPAVMRILEEHKTAGGNHQELLLKLSKIPGVYVPSFFTENTENAPADAWLNPLYPHHLHAVRQVIPDLNDAAYPVHQVIPFGAVHNRLALEIARGCTRGCRFCQAGSTYRPVRERNVEHLQNILNDCLQHTGFDDVSYLSLSTGDFSTLKQLFMGSVARCAQEQISVSLPSLRVGSIDDSIMEKMADIRRTGATLAPEAGSQRLRDVINKGITEEEVILHVQKLFEHGWQQVKLYFMIGLPTESDEDILAILDLCKKVRDAAGPGIKRLQVTAAISPFVPKPHTPFQWEQQTSREEIRRRIGLLLQAVKTERRIKIRWHEPEMSFLEGIFSRGDRRLAPVVAAAYAKGAIFTSWIDQFTLAPWLEALQESGLSPEDFLRARLPKESLPWDHLHSGLSKKYLLRERQKGYAAGVTSDCRYTQCHACGVCDTGSMQSLLHAASVEYPREETLKYANILNAPQRDQEKHIPRFDEHGRIIVQPPSGGKNTPGAIAEHLKEKTAHLRFWYSKEEAAIYLSQLELQDIFNRSMRRAGLPLSFSQGFHPLPLISFGRALPVGVASKSEWFSVYLQHPVQTNPLAEKMNQGLPKGLCITSIEKLPLKKSNADSLQETYHLAARLPENRLQDFSAAWDSIATLQEIPWLRETKKGQQQLDVKQFLRTITSCGENGFTLLFDWSIRYVSPVQLCLAAMTFAGFPITLPDILLTKTGQTTDPGP